MKLIVLSSGGYGHTVADVAEQLGYDPLFLDDSLSGHELSTFFSYIDDYTEFIPCFRKQRISTRMAETLRIN